VTLDLSAAPPPPPENSEWSAMNPIMVCFSSLEYLSPARCSIFKRPQPHGKREVDLSETGKSSNHETKYYFFDVFSTGRYVLALPLYIVHFDTHLLTLERCLDCSRRCPIYLQYLEPNISLA
jgi:hypothetical protein